ncbi:MAG: sterol desaturase family protein [Nannocystaceae bacterium]|nr:sterol desaturase family protein [Nannocystaceae bacterium]
MNASTSSAVLHRVGDDPRASGLTLLEAGLIFTRRGSPRRLVALVSVFAVARIVVGGLSAWDLLLVAAFVGLQPMTEWVVHTGILHWRPRKLGPLRIDTLLSSAHRAHHERPHDEAHWFIPFRSGFVGVVFAMVAGWILLPTMGLWLSMLFIVHAIALSYEWTHFLCHSSYRPQGRVYKRIWRFHRLHHFKNEHYWMGVTMHMGDLILGTRPDPKAVETSPTCRKLYG